MFLQDRQSMAQKCVLRILLPLLCFILHSTSGAELTEHPQSRLIPVGYSVNFTCRFRDVQTDEEVHWIVNDVQTNVDDNVDDLMKQGFFIYPKVSMNGMATLTLRVNGSYDTVNNSRIQCISTNTITATVVSWSRLANLLTIEELPIFPNPQIEQLNATTLVIKWSPPFIWPGYLIEHYMVRITNSRNGTPSTDWTRNFMFSDPVVSFVFTSPYIDVCTDFTFEIVPDHDAIRNQTVQINGTLFSSLGGFTVEPQELFKSDGTPVLRVKIKPSTMICANQDMTYSVSVEDKRQSTLVATKGPISKRGPSAMELEITSESLKRRREYLMKVAIATTFEDFNGSYDVDTYLDSDPTDVPCTSQVGDNADRANTFKYKVAMSACLALVLVMLFTLLSLIVCLVIHRRRKISQQKNFDQSTNRVQNAMVHNPIYDGPVYESVQPHFDSLTSVTKQDLSSSNTSACNSPPPNCSSSTPPNTLGNNSQGIVRYLDRPVHSIQPHAQRSLSLSNPSTPDNDVNQLAMSTQVPTQRSMALKKNGKERNKLHLTLTLVGENEEANAKQPTVSKDAVLGPSRDRSMTVPSVQVSGGPRSSGDDNYSVMKPLAGSGMNTVITELSPEDTEKYRE